jgi:hypothetical protein
VVKPESGGAGWSVVAAVRMRTENDSVSTVRIRERITLLKKRKMANLGF